MRLPGWAYKRLESLYLAQRGIRRREANQRMTDDDRRLREWADRKSIEHDMGTCDGAAAGCPYVPCVPFTGWGG